MIANADLFQALVALLALLAVAYAGGAVFARLHQPRVIGEILGGLLLGPTVLGAFAPGAVAWMFTEDPSSRAVIGAVQQLGLYLLMFCSGIEARRRIRSSERRLVATMSLTGLLIPFVLGLAAVGWLGMHRLWGPNATSTSFVLVFASAIAVTSIPVIARIMHDLGVLRTGFARIVLGVAVVEDVVLYTVLAVAIDLSGKGGKSFGLPHVLGLTKGSAVDIAYHVVLTVGLLLALALTSGRLNRWIGGHRRLANAVTSSTARRLTVLLVFVVGYLALDLEAFLGAFVAGIIVGGNRAAQVDPDVTPSDAPTETPSAAQDAIRRFSYAFFIPVYFALVGVNLNLRSRFEVWLFALFLVFACGAKAVSVYLGARIARLPHRPALNLSVALNARGGPGIVLATVTLAAGIINEEFYIWLVLLAIITSLAAGSWMQRLPARAFNEDLTGSEGPDRPTPHEESLVSTR
jgi:Kef-type K+ transport system membrane component KefB